ncbi:MAG: hypothetical protein V2I33_15620 [Kangiellaceae bacterium]|jgi:hypothetical protein|nr:hypothetical protein [Kangiellaceae bacterium]
MKNSSTTIVICLLLSSLSALSNAASLKDIYKSTYDQLYKQYFLSNSELSNGINNINEWLQGPITAQVSALESHGAADADEYELALVIPFRSPSGRSLDKKQKLLEQEILERRKQRFGLYVSGLLRQSIWQWRIAETEFTWLKNKQVWLKDLAVSVDRLQKAGEIDQASFLQWRQQNLAHQMRLKRAELTLAQAKANYRSITGSESLPDNVVETMVERRDLQIMRHPELLLLQLTESQIELSYRQSQVSLQPWQVGIVGRQFNSVLGTESLVGVTFSIPISSNQSTSANNYSEWKKARDALSDTKLETYTQLKRQLTNALHHYSYLSEAQNLLQKQVDLGVKINAIYSKQKTDLPRSYWLEQLIKQQDLKLELEKNRTALSEAVSKINQIVGITL